MPPGHPLSTGDKVIGEINPLSFRGVVFREEKTQIRANFTRAKY